MKCNVCHRNFPINKLKAGAGVIKDVNGEVSNGGRVCESCFTSYPVVATLIETNVYGIEDKVNKPWLIYSVAVRLTEDLPLAFPKILALVTKWWKDNFGPVPVSTAVALGVIHKPDIQVQEF